ncbi:hypothetical protein A3860_22165 [Niastella vici]|uniref:Uncharacterized protein n=1 Tax=Niastella vici TaxID=1703345 RepID=A0A1V9G0L5_9BACT|nr:hypothetical protein [Niastella vici]OQP64114.1 hypothetical protein A3860_22165 [Niastella vici]
MNNKKPVLTLITLFLAAFGIITLLAFLAKNTNEKKNGFKRRMLTGTLKIRKLVTLPVSVSRIIGLQPDAIYFQDNTPYAVHRTNADLDSLKTLTIPIPPYVKANSSIRMFVRGRHLYIACRNLPGILDYNLDSGNVDRYGLEKFFGKETNFAKDQFILKTIEPKTNDAIFVKIDLKSKYPAIEDHFTERNKQNAFATDGMLYYDSTTHLACYTYFYQNGFICMDTNLNLKLTARTIDTLTKREIKVAHVGSSYTMKQPPQFVNNLGAVAAGKLFLESMLQADNEYSLDFTENAVIDVYNLINGSYKGSFYIPPYQGKKPHQFHVINKTLYAIYSNTVILYDLGFIQDL